MTYYDSIKTKICERGCGLTIEWKGKIEGKHGSTGWFEKGTNHEHTFLKCDRIIKINKEKAKHGSLF
jgi:hypothetical protein